MTKKTFEFKGFVFSSSLLTLKTRKTWQTSHSSTNHRDNFLVTIKYNGFTGLGQAGLPPKKPKCYLADVNDCFEFFEAFQKKILSQEIVIDETILNVQNYFLSFKNDENKSIFYSILSALHFFKQPHYRAAISAIEFAVFDIWAQTLKKPLLQCIYGQVRQYNFKSFLSIAISEGQVQEARDSIKLTPFIKLKFKDNFQRISQTLTTLIQDNVGQLIVLDANASWSSETTKKVISFIAEKGYQKRIYCLQQPYQVQPNLEQWKSVYELAKQKNVNIMADETFTNANDVEFVKQISNGVNIKIEKTGGLIEGIKAAIKAQQQKLNIWLGIMISSWLGCTQTYMLIPFSDHGDLDGGYIVHSPFKSGFKSSPDGHIDSVQGNGLGVQSYDIQN